MNDSDKKEDGWKEDLIEALRDLGDFAVKPNGATIEDDKKNEEAKPKETYHSPHSKKGRLTLVYSSGRHKIRKRR
jgi:hypothetical protein